MVTLNPFTMHENYTEAKERREFSQVLIAEGVCRVNVAREEAFQAMRAFGKLKAICFNSNGISIQLKEILDTFNLEEGATCIINGQIQHFKMEPPPPAFESLHQAAINYTQETLKGTAAGATSGALLALAAYSSVQIFGLAGTGTAIATLKGAAATNATLAWLGGGTMAVGSLALGATVAIPTLIICGISLSAKIDKELAEAEQFYFDARENYENNLILAEKSTQMKKVIKLARKILKRLAANAENRLPRLQAIEPKDFNSMQEDEQELVYRAFTIYDLINNFTNIKILNEDTGALIEDAESKLQDIEKNINTKLGETA